MEVEAICMSRWILIGCEDWIKLSTLRTFFFSQISGALIVGKLKRYNIFSHLKHTFSITAENDGGLNLSFRNVHKCWDAAQDSLAI